VKSQKVKNRKIKHKQRCKNNKELKVYKRLIAEKRWVSANI
jgi:hypothetical protein